jgi:hypothetical protein
MYLICYLLSVSLSVVTLSQLTHYDRIDFRAQNFFAGLMLSIGYETTELYQGQNLVRVKCDNVKFVDCDMKVLAAEAVVTYIKKCN